MLPQFFDKKLSMKAKDNKKAFDEGKGLIERHYLFSNWQVYEIKLN